MAGTDTGNGCGAQRATSTPSTRLPRVQPVYAAPALSSLLESTARTVQAVLQGRSLADLLPALEPARRPAVQALTFHVLRHLGSARQALRLLASRPPPAEVDALLTSALALLWPGSPPPYPDHTLVDQAVRAVRARAAGSAGFANAVLRHFLREREALAAQVAATPEGRWNHPAWWVRRLREDWPEAWEAVLEAAAQRPPMTLRVNARRTRGAAWVQRLAEEGRGATLLADPAFEGQAVVLDEPCPVERLPGFAQGEVSVQDAAAQRAAGLLLAPPGARALPAGARVLDACAAPGGKTAHLLERAELDLLALDSDPARLARVQQNLQRLGLAATLRAADAADPAAWWDGRPFDAILLDAPCTASGIVRRHPDVRWLRLPGDIAALAAAQARLLDALWPLLAPGGRLLYATCSVFRAEGQGTIDAFLQRLGTQAARLDPASPGHLLPLPDNQVSPGSSGAAGAADGFFYALLHKN